MTQETQYPYLYEQHIEIVLKYNKNYGDYRICVCGDPYHRHFDSYENMEAIGCKYCDCRVFVEQNGEPTPPPEQLIEKVVAPTGWIDCSTGLVPPDLMVVIVEYSGEWPHRGRSGISDEYCYGGQWFNIPETAKIERWMYIPQ
jgi:hypothetical protein